MTNLRCNNCGMYGNKQQVKYKIAQTLLGEKLIAMLCCKHCNDSAKLLCADFRYGSKIYIESQEQLDELDHWELKIAPTK